MPLSSQAPDPFIAFLNTRIHEAVLECLDREVRGQLLEAGAGDGTLAARLKGLGFEVRAIDLFPEAFQPVDIPIEKADLNKGFPFGSEEFDVVVATEVIEHLENPWLFMRELYRITRPGGVVVVTTPNLGNIYVRAYFLLTGKLFNFLDNAYYKIGHVTPVFLWNLRRMAESKFDVESVTVNESPIPKTRIRLPWRAPFFGQCIVVKLRRLPGPPMAEPRIWTSAIIREPRGLS
jgi:SAM-dependent methyltransferase